MSRDKTRDRLPAHLAARLIPGAGSKTPASPPADDAADTPKDARRAQRQSDAGRRARLAGATAEAYLDGVCDELVRQRRLWWVRIEDPMRPLHTAPGGKYICVPTPRPHATDRVGAVKVDGFPHLIAWEIKSVDLDAGSWSLSELRPAQVASLDKAARFGASACVVLIGLEAGCFVRAMWVLPWADGALPLVRDGAPLKLDDPALDAYKIPLHAAHTWIDHAGLAHNQPKK